ncbi:MAG: hypothetical protein OER80_06910 [Gammaproteobacteria bacterium]|nr:hypothetical protein [Gammaproteobacteria bacterium]MDH3769082.1 hypothetical protein [Gammaproteobacteria bacterium]
MPSLLKVQFIHGLESSPQGAKSQRLAGEFNTLTPAMDTSDFEACVQIQNEQLAAFAPDVLVGSSFGGAVALAMVQRRLWSGPTLLLAQAGLHYGLSASLPDGVSVWLVHGRSDDVVDPQDSRRLAAAGNAKSVRLIEVDDDHRLRKSVANGDLIGWVRALATLP